ncbi:MAG: S8 family serine peptidase, partial [Terriglobia bacterium]
GRTIGTEMPIAQDLERLLGRMKPDEVTHVVVRFEDPASDHARRILDRPGRVLRHIVPMFQVCALSLPVRQVKELAEEAGVVRVERDKEVLANVDKSSERIGVPNAFWNDGITGQGVKIAVVDTGVDRFHADLEGRVVGFADFTLEGFQDFNGHGTHVACVVAGTGEESNGKYKGVAPDSVILAAKALRADGSGRSSDVIAALEWSILAGAQVICLPLGAQGPCDGRDLLSQACDSAVAGGVVVCVAAGNEGPNRGTIGSPGCARDVITVGVSNELDRLAEFSARGPTLDGRTKPDLVAPGVNVVSGLAKDVKMGKPVDGCYTSATGASMAVAHVTGVCALLLQSKPLASPALVREALTRTAKNLEIDEYAQGAGRVEAGPAVQYFNAHENPPEIDEVAEAPNYLGALADLGERLKKIVQRNTAPRERDRPLDQDDDELMF